MRGTTALVTATAAVTSLLAGAQLASATTYTWDGTDAANSTNWSDILNWVGDTAAPAAAADVATFDSTGVANLANKVDPGLSTAQLTQVNYRQDDPTKTYITSIDRSLNLTLTGLAGNSQTALVTNSSVVVMPTTAAGATATAANVVIQSVGAGTGGKLSITSGGFLVTGKPGAGTATAESSASLDLSGLDGFSYAQATNSVFGIGTGTESSTNDNGAYSGKLILSNTSSITVNRVVVGGQDNAGATGSQPLSTLLFGTLTNINTALPGNMYVGCDPTSTPSKDGSGAALFRVAGGTLNVGDNGNNRNGLEIARGRAGTGHSQYGVFDGTSASGQQEGNFNAFYAGITIGAEQSGTSSAGGGFGMLSMDSGTIDTNTITLARTTSAPTAGSPMQAVLNVGLKGTATDSGLGTVNALNAGTGGIFVARRQDASSGTNSVGILNLANGGAVNADRIFLGDNTQAGGTGTVVGVVNLGGGTLTTSKVQAGSDTAQAGLTPTRLVNFNGGTLKVQTGATQANRDNFLQGITAANVYSGGGTIDTNGQDTTINQPLVAPAGQGIASIAVATPGSGYRAAPIVVINRGTGDTTGIGATAVANIDSTGAVTGITVTNPGTGYTAAPVIQLIANGGTTIANMSTPYGGTAATTVATLAANTSGGITKTGAGVLTVNGVNTYTGPTAVNNGELRLGANLTTSSSVSATATGKLSLPSNGTFNRVIKTGSASVSGSGKIDIDNNKMILTAQPVGSWNGSAYTDVTGLVASGYSLNQDFSGSGIVTSQSSASGGNTLNNIGVASNADLGLATFGGQSVGAGDTLVMYTYNGDANLDGVVNGDDYFQIDSAFPQGGSGWFNGDFNYDGVINGDDYFVIDSTFPQQGTQIPTSSGISAGSLAGVTAVPEPASIGLFGVAAASLLGRRRRHRAAAAV